MIKTKKGQLIILDVLFGIVLVLLTFFLLFKIAEIDIYKTNTDKSTEKLNSIGTLAYQKLLNNPQINCSVNGAYVPGTIKDTQITKAKLGIPFDYNCNLSGGINTECNQTPPGTSRTPIFSVDATLVSCSSVLTQQEYYSYILNYQEPSTQTVTLKIWRNN